MKMNVITPSKVHPEVNGNNNIYKEKSDLYGNRENQDELPSQQALHSTLGTTLTRRKMSETAKETRHKKHAESAYGHVHATRDQMDSNTLEEAKKRGLRLDSIEEEHLDELEKMKQLEIIRMMPVNLHIKRMLREKVLEVPTREKTKGCCATYRYMCKLNHLRRSRSCRMCCLEFNQSITLWSGAFKKIEGHFGSGVLTYFTFLKWLFQLNLGISIMLFLFVTLPMIIFSGLDYDETVTGSSTTSAAVNLSINCSDLYVVNTTGQWYEYILDFLQGTGYMEQTVLFYGYYVATELDISGVNYNYNMPLAYLICAIAYFIISLCVMVHNTAAGFKERVFANHGEFEQFGNKVFGGWDFSIDNEKSGKLIHVSLHRELEALLKEDRERLRRETRDGKQECKVWTLRILMWLIVLIILGGCGYLIFFVTTKQAELTKGTDYETYNLFVQLLIQYMTSVTVTVLNAVVPLLFKKLVLLEDYSPGLAVNITLSRTVLLRLSSLAVLVASLYTEVSCSEEDYCGVGTGSCTSIRCWETYVGQEFFKLVILNLFVQIGIVFLVETPRRVIVDKCSCKLAEIIGRQEFDIPKSVLDLIYMQTLLWFGAFFSPLIPAITTTIMLILFYLKYFTAMYNYVPQHMPYRSSKSSEFFLVTLLVTYTLCIVPLVYVIYIINPSKSCGPFRIYDEMYEIIPITIDTWPQGLQSLVSFIKSAAIIVPLFVILCLTIYYLAQVLITYKSTIKILKEQLQMEGRDKEFLLKKIAKLTGQDLMPPPKKVSKRPKHESISEDPSSVVVDDGYPMKKANGAGHDVTSPHVPHDTSF